MYDILQSFKEQGKDIRNVIFCLQSLPLSDVFRVVPLTLLVRSSFSCAQILLSITNGAFRSMDWL